jgi:hypothetical protein
VQQQIRESLVGRAKNLGTGGMEVGEEIDGHIVLDVLPLVGMLESSVTGARRKVFAERKRSSIKRVLLALSTRAIPLQVRVDMHIVFCFPAYPRGADRTRRSHR